MSKINTNVSPYFDDFDENKNYHQVLFKSGLPIQARELNNIQSIHHNQIKQLSDTNYDDGDLISGGEISYDKNLDTVIIQSKFNNIDIDTICEKLIGKDIKGNVTDVSATVIYFIPSYKSEKNSPTLYIKYTSSGKIINGIQYDKFADNETLTNQNIPFAKTISLDATKYISSIVHVNDGILYWQGYYVKFLRKSIILEQYSNISNFKVGINFEYKFIDALDDPLLNNNSNGYINTAAIGADRLSINTKLAKLSYNEKIPKNFKEILSIKNGEIEYTISPSISNQISTAIANRTYEQSGNFTIENFKISVKETLNDLFNNGVYDSGEKETDGYIVSNVRPLINETNKIYGNDYVSVELSSGSAIIKGYTYNYQKNQIISIPKSKEIDKKINNQLFVDCGTYLEITEIFDILDLTNSYKLLKLYDDKYELTTKKLIGTAKAISINQQSDNITRIYLIDISTYTKIYTTGGNADLKIGDYIEGNISGATGYVRAFKYGTSFLGIETGSYILLESITGIFINLEPITNSRNEIMLTIIDIEDYIIDNVKSIVSPTTDRTKIFTTGGNANLIVGDVVTGEVSGATGVVYNFNYGGSFLGIEPDSYITLQNITGIFIDGETLINSRNATILTITNITGFSANVIQEQFLVKGNNYKITNNLTDLGAKLFTTGGDANLVVGDTVTGITSGASGIVYEFFYGGSFLGVESGSFVILKDIVGSFINNESISNSNNATVLTIVDIDNYIINNPITTGSAIIGTDTKFREEFQKGSSIIIGNIIGNVANILNDNIIILDTIFINQNIDSLYKLKTTIKSNNKNLFVELPKDKIKLVENTNFTINKNISVTFSNGIANISNQNNNEISYGTVLVQTKTNSYTASFTNTNTIKIDNNVNYNGIADVTFKNQILNGQISNSTLQKHKVIRYDKTKLDTMYSPFGTRYQDNELSLGVPNVKDILTIRYSNNNKTNINYVSECFDNITVSSSTLFNIGDIIYNNNAKAKIIEISNDILFLIYYTNNHFVIGDTIINWNNNINSTILEKYSGSYVDITENYVLIKNDNSATFDISKFKILDKNKLPLNDVVVVLDYYEPNINNIITVDSYVEGLTNNKLDFRIFAKKCDIIGNGNILSPYILQESGLNPVIRKLNYKKLLSSNSIIKYDYEYYLSRIDLAVIDDSGKYKIIKGVSAETPVAPDLPKECLAIANIKLNAYTETINEVGISTFNNERYTMQDIGNIERRVENLETEIALSRLENLANNLVLLDNSNTSRLKTGFVVDEFTNLNLLDTKNLNNCSCIDIKSKVLVPETETKNIHLAIENGTFSKNKSLISLPYTDTSFVTQNKYSTILAVNSANFTNWEGILVTEPSADNWYTGEKSNIKYDWLPLTTIETKNKIKYSPKIKNNNFLKQQTIKVNIDSVKPNTKLNLYINSKNIDDLIVPSKCNIIKDGSRGTNNISFIVGESLLWKNPNARVIPGSKYQPSVISNYKEAVVDSLDINYSGNTPLLKINWGRGYNFELEDIKPGCYIIGKTSGAIGILKATNIISDDNGNFSGNIFIPNPIKSNYKFETGELLISAIGKNTFAKYKFICGGNTSINTKSIISLRLPSNNDSNIIEEQINFNTNNSNISWNNPLSQTFVNNQLGGCFVSSIELYFLEKDLNIPIITQIRTVENGYPTETIVPLSEISTNPNNISISTDGKTPTKIIFNDIVYLKEGQTYAISILSNSNKYKLCGGILGQVDINNKEIINKNSNILQLFQVQNTKNWIADKEKSLKFILNKAKFENFGNVEFKNYPNKKVFVDNAINTTKNSNLVKINCKNHGFHTSNNQLDISNIKSENNPTILTNIMSDAQTTTISTLAVETPQLIPQLINNIPISTTNPGYLKIDNELISYTSVNNITKLVTIPIGGRGINNTNIEQHATNTVVEIYSLYGIPLTELNNTFTSVLPIDLDTFGVYTISKANITNVGGGSDIIIDTNSQYESILANMSYKYFPNTNIFAKLFATTATSISSDASIEPSFLNYESNISFNDINLFNKPLMIASNKNELLLGRDSLKLNIELSTNNENISPIIDYDKCSVVISTNRINNVNSNELSPTEKKSAFVYISKPISLILPSQSVNVIFDAIKKIDQEILVYIKIEREDNLIEFEKNNFILIPAISYPNGSEFQEFRYEIRNIPQYKKFQIKLVGKSNTQSLYPQIKNLRIINTAT